MQHKQRTRLTPEARVDHLLDTAKQMIMDEGLQSFTIEALARTADVSSPLVYNYFDSRQQLLQTLLKREHNAYSARLTEEISNASSFDEVIRLFINSNFDHHAPGNILPVLQSQPEIADSVKKLRRQQAVQAAQYLVRNTAKTYQLTIEQAQIAVTMSSGASIAAADLAMSNGLNRQQTIDNVLRYIKAGMAAIASDGQPDDRGDNDS
jgi:AcrR family transcriptional regulator